MIVVSLGDSKRTDHEQRSSRIDFDQSSEHEGNLYQNSSENLVDEQRMKGKEVCSNLSARSME
jgi:hypothetical protein